MNVSLTSPPPATLRVGRGTALFLHGRLEPDGESVRRLRLSIGDRGPAVETRRAGSDWWAILPIAPVAGPLECEITLEADLASAATRNISIAPVELEPGEGPAEEPAPDVWPGDADDRIAICMGTHNPPLELFRRQIESIREQTHREWLCVISDDASSEESREAMREIIGGDERFVLRPSDLRLGFYSNFERVLGLAPRGATHIALCDQDDRWRPERLETLLAALGPEDTLAYSDMRIVFADGEVLSDTFWRHRRNNWTDLGKLLIGNRISGAASLFRRSLLDYALPFPPRVGTAFHDHWLAVVALATGSVSYVDRPLYDYMQHADAVIGHSSARARRTEDGPRGLSGRGLRLAGRLIRPEARRRYFEDYCRIALAAAVLELRCGELMSPEKRDAVARIRGLDDSLGAAAGLAFRSLAPGPSEMGGVDRSVLAGLAWSRLARRRS